MPTHGRRVWTGIAAASAIGAVGAVDFLSGSELRVFALYYLPISLLAWRFGRPGALIGTGLCALSWLASNVLAGLRFSDTGLWIANTLVQAASFAVVGLLIASLRAALTRERTLSRVDPLTLLLNTRAFHDEGRRLLALCRRNGRPVTIAYIDVDDFKTVNDRWGHKAGDELLRQVGALLRASVRPSDLSARLGGDEFALLLPELGSSEAAATLERLRALLADPARLPSPVTCSIGVVTFMTAPDDLDEVLRRSDARMYAAKQAGKNRAVHEVVAETPRPTHGDLAGDRRADRPA